jgi:hypothetical protein
MNRDDIIRMARESGECQLSDRQFQLHGLEQITRFANIVAAAERERCVAESFKALVGKGVGWEIRQLVSHAIKGPQ